MTASSSAKCARKPGSSKQRRTARRSTSQADDVLDRLGTRRARVVEELDAAAVQVAGTSVVHLLRPPPRDVRHLELGAERGDAILELAADAAIAGVDERLQGDGDLGQAVVDPALGDQAAGPAQRANDTMESSSEWDQ